MRDTSKKLLAVGEATLISLGVSTLEATPEEIHSFSCTRDQEKSCILDEDSKKVELDVSDESSKNVLEAYPISFDKKVFSFDENVNIRLRSPLILKQTNDGKHIIVTNWNCVEIPFNGFLVENLEKEILRYFQEIYAKSAAATLSEDEKKTWLKMLRSFDYASFSQELSPAMYDQGEIRAINDKTVTIVWSDNKRQTIPVAKSIRFSNGTLKKGDHIGAMVKHGLKDEVVSISEIKLLPKPKKISVNWTDLPSI